MASPSARIVQRSCMANRDDVAAIVRELYALVDRLETLFPGRKFTPDGHLVGSLGEALAQRRYGLRLLPCSTECHDADGPDGRLVQVKATQGNKDVALYAVPEHLIVLQLQRDGTAEEVYNGPGELACRGAGEPGKNGQFRIRLSRLRRLMVELPPNSRLPNVGS
jgi:hypothetical protein